MSSGELRGSRLTKVYPGGVKALDDVSFVAQPGRALTLLGQGTLLGPRRRRAYVQPSGRRSEPERRGRGKRGPLGGELGGALRAAGLLAR